MSSFDAHTDSDWPPLDERLVEPGTRYEMFDGELVYVPPADPPHATRHSVISALVELHVAPDFQVASDMLTRTSKVDDVAPDVSIFPRARDPETGRRQLEQLTFDVVSRETISRAGRRASKLAARGVRRIFAIDVERARALEWSVSLGTWSLLDPGTVIEDRTLAAPLRIAALVGAATADDDAARALIVKRNPVFEAARAQERAEGVVRGKVEALLAIVAARGLVLEDGDRARIYDERDPARLDRWIGRATSCADIRELCTDS